MSTAEVGEQPPLQTPQDWSEFQMRRFEQKTLVEYMSQFGSTQTRDNTWQPHHALHRPPKDATLSALLASGAHMGHSQKLMNPNFMPYAYGVRAGITIIDLDHTLPLLRRAAKVVRSVAARGGSIVFVGTRPDLRAAVRKAAERLGPQGFHVGERWLPGTLTNKLQVFGEDTVRNEQVIPDLVVFLNPIPNLHAIRECAIDHVPTIGVIDSNADPRIVMYPIPANDESTRTGQLIAGVLSLAGREGVAIRQQELDLQEKQSEERWRQKAAERASRDRRL
ncbi:ribosomal protein S2, flavodoxin-like domain-containing protein [Cristinia sonorae]|uniref:Ribosomal protein S2, flavodoxin-like domain-containing protein n=1 Tax=Cristinia sonorae TaxID=1940300 RepID=A0A8K0UZ13_9AGAR|nr:ribosomal protein S2, flavodoxin-like domain-containing protein [Cristinia sonorae]